MIERCDPCAAKGLDRAAVEDAQLWAGGPWAYVCDACAYRARSHREAWAKAAIASGPKPAERGR